MNTKLQSDGTIMPRSSAAIGCAVATFDFDYLVDADMEVTTYGFK